MDRDSPDIYSTAAGHSASAKKPSAKQVLKRVEIEVLDNGFTVCSYFGSKGQDMYCGPGPRTEKKAAKTVVDLDHILDEVFGISDSYPKKST